MGISFLAKHKAKKPGMCSLYILPDSLITAYVVPQADQPPMLQCLDIKNYTDKESLRTALETTLKQFQLENVTTSWVLNPDNYQIILLEKPAVEPNEINQAIRWQLRKSLGVAPEEVIINYLDLPLFYKREEKTEIFVSVAQRQILQEMADLICECGFKLNIIDIPEMALRNLSAAYGDEDCYVGMLLLKTSGSGLTITHKKSLLLTRSIPLSIENTEEVALEIQRSFVFCQNQQQQTIPKKLLIAPENTELASYLSSQLEVEAEVLPMKKLLSCSCNYLDNLSHEQIIAIGAALRTAEEINATN